MGKGLSYLKNWGLGVNYCWNCGPSKLLLHFIEYPLDQLNSKHRKSSSKLKNTIFWRLLLKEMSALKRNVCLKFFGPSATKWRPYKIFAKMNGTHLLMANIFKLHEYETFGSMKMHNMCTIWLPITCSVYENIWFTIKGPLKRLFINFCLIPFSKFQMTIVKNLSMDFEGS